MRASISFDKGYHDIVQISFPIVMAVDLLSTYPSRCPHSHSRREL